jgi:hypothetical protein
MKAAIGASLVARSWVARLARRSSAFLSLQDPSTPSSHDQMAVSTAAATKLRRPSPPALAEPSFIDVEGTNNRWSDYYVLVM